jgi:hypothetical protein
MHHRHTIAAVLSVLQTSITEVCFVSVTSLSSLRILYNFRDYPVFLPVPSRFALPAWGGKGLKEHMPPTELR